MKSLIFTNPTTKETTWFMANVVDAIPIDQIVAAVDFGFGDDERTQMQQVANFAWVDQPEEVTQKTHAWNGVQFVELPLPSLSASDVTSPTIL